jgi:hypothetical protein
MNHHLSDLESGIEVLAAKFWDKAAIATLSFLTIANAIMNFCDKQPNEDLSPRPTESRNDVHSYSSSPCGGDNFIHD